MRDIQKKIMFDASLKKSLEIFLSDLGSWWPKEYTWSKEELVALKVNPTVNGFFTEIGPYGFQCDWGRIINFEEQAFTFLWQMGPDRVPEPNPDKASEVEISFSEDDGYTTMILTHRNFAKHGEKGGAYQEMMDAPEGWDYILACFVEHLLTKTP
ncbi:SRPBCC domain-containing protein [Olivibacter sp. XZL3]|uniref:SRPBCC domain-containing protein n=1 Tax=Olivibacter sp. XZL3 TaxID=1735116 RepID=UPI0010651D18|nr:SRPBCC domain-containing protein [Olivibacter sp. XZL3]